MFSGEGRPCCASFYRLSTVRHTGSRRASINQENLQNNVIQALFRHAITTRKVVVNDLAVPNGGCVGDGAFRFSYLQREYLRRHEFSSPVLTSTLSEHTSRNP
jgi:hypothetical protein